MTHFVEMGGETRPLRFGFEVLYRYEVETGRKALADFAEFQQGVESVSVVRLVDLIYTGLMGGYKAERRNVDFQKEDVAAWLDGGVLNTVLEAFSASFPPDAGNGQARPAKTKAPAQAA